jgi:hypothetical protein
MIKRTLADLPATALELLAEFVAELAHAARARETEDARQSAAIMAGTRRE